MLQTVFIASYLMALCSATQNFWQETMPGAGLTYTVPNTVPYATYVQTANGVQAVYFQPQSNWVMSNQPFMNDPLNTVTPVYVPLDTLRTNQQNSPQIYSVPSDQDSDEDENALMIGQESSSSPDLPVPCSNSYVTPRKAAGVFVFAFLLISILVGLLTYFLTKGNHHGYN